MPLNISTSLELSSFACRPQVSLVPLLPHHCPYPVSLLVPPPILEILIFVPSVGLLAFLALPCPFHLLFSIAGDLAQKSVFPDDHASWFLLHMTSWRLGWETGGGGSPEFCLQQQLLFAPVPLLGACQSSPSIR